MAIIDFSDSDLLILRMLVDEHKRRVNRSLETQLPEFAPQRTDVYIAKTPDGGIPARDGLEPGYATCNIYKMVEIDYKLDPTTLEQVFYPDGSAYTKVVYNVTTSIVTESYVPIERTKFGFWVPAGAGGGGVACDFIRFQILSVTQSLQPYYAEVDILARPCGCDAVNEEVAKTGTDETLRVYDMAGCFLNEPAADLVGRVGYAKYLIDEMNIGVLSGTSIIDNCNWEIISLCCPAC